MKKFSIIIPAFNAEKCIERCFSSIIKQDFDNYEIIVVDDCSSDQTANQVERLSQQNPNIMVKLHRNERNLGVAASRNVGIRLATGEFLLFVDADDQLTRPDVLTKVANKTLNSENLPDAILFGGFIHYKTTSGKTWFKFYLRVGRHDHDLNFQMHRKIMHYVWLMCVRRDFLLEHNLQFQEDLQVYEDVIFRAQVLSWTKHIETIAEFFYDYNRQLSHNSLSCDHTNTLKHKFAILKIAIRRIDELADDNLVPARHEKDFRRFKRLYLLGILIIIANHAATKFIHGKKITHGD